MVATSRINADEGTQDMQPMTWMAAGCTAVALGVAGCGGGGDEALSKKELGEQASAICAKYSKEGDKLKAPEDITDAEAAGKFFGDAADISKRQQDELEGLEPADSVKDDYAALTKATGKATTLLADLESAAKDKDASNGGKLLQQLQPISDEVTKTAKAVGADDCAGT